MGYFQVRYNSRVINYKRRGFIRLATGLYDWMVISVSSTYWKCQTNLETLKQTSQVLHFPIFHLVILFLKWPLHTLVAFIRINNARGPLLQPTACRSQTCSLTTATKSDQTKMNFLKLCHMRSFRWMGASIRCKQILVSRFTCSPHGDLL